MAYEKPIAENTFENPFLNLLDTQPKVGHQFHIQKVYLKEGVDLLANDFDKAISERIGDIDSESYLSFQELESRLKSFSVINLYNGHTRIFIRIQRVPENKIRRKEGNEIMLGQEHFKEEEKNTLTVFSRIFQKHDLVKYI